MQQFFLDFQQFAATMAEQMPIVIRSLNVGFLQTLRLFFVTLLGALPLGLVGARLFYCLSRLAIYTDMGLVNVLRLWDGGYALWGAVGGAVR